MQYPEIDYLLLLQLTETGNVVFEKRKHDREGVLPQDGFLDIVDAEMALMPSPQPYVRKNTLPVPVTFSISIAPSWGSIVILKEIDQFIDAA